MELLALRAQHTSVLDYVGSVDLQFSGVLQSIMRYSFSYADPYCASLALWACEACGGDSRVALPIAASVECMHRFAVLHDELQNTPGPALERRTTSSIWGFTQTLNAGDAFHAVALQMLATDSTYAERVIEVGVMLSETVLQGVEQRSRLVARSTRAAGSARFRLAYGGMQSLMLGSSLRAGAMMAGAPAATSGGLSHAGRLLGVAIQLAAYARKSGPSPAAERYAVKAVSAVEGTLLERVRVQEFREIAHHLAAGN